jgi:ketosteroid isomerase-like protein
MSTPDDTTRTDPVTLARRYLRAIEESDVDTLDAVLHPDVVFREMPNRLKPDGAVVDRSAIHAAFAKGRSLLASQSYEVTEALAVDGRVALQVEWSGTVASAAPPFAEGQVLRAHFAMFLEVRDGQIFRQINYDCFEPF